MNKEWTTLPFDECLEPTTKPHKIQTADYKVSGAFPIVSQEEVFISGYWDNIDDVFHITHPIVVFGDHTRVLKYVDFDFVVGADGVKILSPKSFLLPKFLFYYLIWLKVPSLGYSRHYKLLRETCVPIPSQTEQAHIVGELDLLSSILEKQRLQLKELDTLAQSVFYDMFGDPVENEKGWGTGELNSVCDVRDGTHDSPSYQDKGYPLVTSKNITGDGISFSDVNYISQEDFDAISKRSYVDDGDIVMPMIGTIGKPTIVRKEREFAIKNVALIKFLPNSAVLNTFIRAIIASSSFDVYMRSKNKGGTQKFIALGDIRKLRIPVPPLGLQQSFDIKIKAIEHEKALINQAIVETQKLIDYAMDKYFG